MPQQDEEELNKNRICIHCVGELFLKDEIARTGSRQKCSYCHKTAKTFSLNELTEKVETAFEQFYTRTASDPDDWEYYKQNELGHIWVRDGEPIVQIIKEAGDFPNEVARDIQIILEEKFFDMDQAAIGIETEYSSETYYTLKDHNDEYWQEQWQLFGQSLKHESRLFNSKAKKILESIFDDLRALKTHQGKPVIIDAGPGTRIPFLYRARTFMSDESLRKALIEPDQELGPPPAKFATGGRMNCTGIAVFYGANSPDVAISEVRPPIGSKVALAKFQIVKPLRIVDLSALTTVTASGSIFDPAELGRREKQTFLRKLTRLLTTPIMPGDEELAYIPTQAVADFLAEGVKPQMDGIQFSSVQSGDVGMNIVLFHKSSLVEKVTLPAGTAVAAHLRYEDDELYFEYAVHETRTKTINTPIEKNADKSSLFQSFENQKATNLSNFALKIELESIEIHEIKAVSFSKDVYPVRRIIFEEDTDLNETKVFGV